MTVLPLLPLTASPRLLTGGPQWTWPRGPWVGTKWTPLDPAPGQSFPPASGGLGLAAHPTACRQDSSGNSWEGRPQGAGGPRPRGPKLPGGTLILRAKELLLKGLRHPKTAGASLPGSQP